MASSARENDAANRGNRRQPPFPVLVAAFHTRHLLTHPTAGTTAVAAAVAWVHHMFWSGVWVSAASFLLGAALVAATPVPANAFLVTDPWTLLGLFGFAAGLGELTGWITRFPG